MSSFVGISCEAAEKRLVEFGLNEVEDREGRTRWNILGDQFKSVLVLLLVVASVVAAITGDRIDAILIILIVGLNAGLGFVQEYKAEGAVKKLKKMGMGVVRVVRGGSNFEVETRNLVPGDIVYLEEGVRVPADGKVLETVELEIDESVLTGESMPVVKAANVATHAGLVFSGTIVSRGRGWMEIVSTGMKTRFGGLALKLTEIVPEETALEVKLRDMSKIMVGVGVVGCLLVVIRVGGVSQKWLEAWSSGVAVAVAVIPEGLPAVLAITLAMGVSRMAREKAVVRRMAAVEALGGATVIATDKTGTITKNIMEVKSEHFWGDRIDAIRCGVLASTAVLVSRELGEWDVIGDQTEGAVLKLAKKEGIDVEEERKRHTIVMEFPFDSRLRLMSVMVDPADTDGYTPVIYVKGAPEKVWERCAYIATNKGPIKISEKTQLAVIEKQKKMAKKGLRVLGFAKRSLSPTVKKIPREEVERDLVWLGMVGISDPLRSETVGVIARAKRDGVKVLLITGDNELTATVIAREAGLIQKDEEVITGEELNKIGEVELEREIGRVRIFARIAPEQKLRIIKALQRSGERVIMTGDGINDALAIKQADVGVAMGKSGTDVARGSADVVLLDDNLDTILKAVENGRKIVKNITSTVKYLLACNIGEVATILVAILLGLPTPLLPVQILWVNLVTDGLPALALAVGPENFREEVSGSPLRFGGRWLVGRADVKWLVTATMFVVGVSLFAFGVWGRSGAFVAIVLSQMVVALAVRGVRSSGVLVWGAVLLVVGLQFVIMSVPALRVVFKV